MPSPRSRRRAWSTRDDAMRRLLDDINARELSDLDTCRRVWEARHDPMALLEAVRLADLPDWLRDALLASLTAGLGPYPDRRKAAWKQRTQDDTLRLRATAFVAARAHPDWTAETRPTWEDATALADALVREQCPDLPAAGQKTVEGAYARLATASADPHRFYHARPALLSAVNAAWRRLAAQLRATPSSDPPPE